MSLVPGPDLEGSRTVASSTPVRISVPFDRGPRAAHPWNGGLDWRTNELRTRPKQRPEPEEIPDGEHDLVAERVASIDVANASGKVCVRMSGGR